MRYCNGGFPVYNSVMDAHAQVDDNEVAEVTAKVRELWEKNRLGCGWFVRVDFSPQSVSECLMCLRLMQKHGDRDTFVASKGMEQWVLQNSNVTSAV
jgi:hypothetical protein